MRLKRWVYIPSRHFCIFAWIQCHTKVYMPGVGLMVRVVGLGSKDPEFTSPLAVELIPGGVESAYRPSKVSKMSAILCWSGDMPRIVPNSQGNCFGSTNAQHRVWSQWMDGWMDKSILSTVTLKRFTLNFSGNWKFCFIDYRLSGPSLSWSGSLFPSPLCMNRGILSHLQVSYSYQT